LIEKDFVHFGHPFAMRCGLSPKDIGEDQKAPIFLQWLDTVQQLLHQFPSAFEFNIDLLIFISNHILSCLYGTFIYNSEQVFN